MANRSKAFVRHNGMCYEAYFDFSFFLKLLMFKTKLQIANFVLFCSETDSCKNNTSVKHLACFLEGIRHGKNQCFLSLTQMVPFNSFMQPI